MEALAAQRPGQEDTSDAPSPLVLRARPVGDQWRTLAEERGSGERFAPALAEHLPLAARRWSTYAVAAGTPLAGSVRLDMSGQIRLGSWRPFTAVQLLVPATGFTWAATTRIGPVPVSGYDRFTAGTGEMRWRTVGIIPVVSATVAMSVTVPRADLPGRTSSFPPRSPSHGGPSTPSAVSAASPSPRESGRNGAPATART
ncbi:DUF6544 family protein [Rhodococcus sp. (in: high G+C Gram-positive bacteria)]|uniref:DUF6544 family protein n=1 Tax=Rhodococcus sp. TaxID=1831 RepID=UPI00389060CE